MELNGHEGSSSDVSDADPAEILNSIKNIDDLDEELFGPKKVVAAKKGSSPSVKAGAGGIGKKRVSFQDPVDSGDRQSKKNIGNGRKKKEGKTDDFDFDLDDPLADLLSDDDDALPPSSGVKNSSSASKKEGADDWLFADDNADDLLDIGANQAREKEKKEELHAKKSVESLMKRSSTDDLLSKSSPGVKKMTLDDFASNAAKLSPEKLATPYTAAKPSAASTSKDIKFDDEFGFGSYEPTLSSPADVQRKKGRSRRTKEEGSGFFDFLTDENGLKSPPQETLLSPKSSKPPTPSHQPSRPSTADTPLQSAANITRSIEPRPRSSEPVRTPSALSSPGHQKQVVYDAPILSSSLERQSRTDGLSSSIATSAPPVVVGQPPRPSRRSVEPTFTTSPFPQSQTAAITSKELQTPLFAPATGGTRIMQGLGQTDVPNGEEARAHSLGAQLAHAKALLHNIELGYKADLELAEATYGSRIELLKTSFEDLKSRVDTELDSVRESYSARIGVLRDAMQTQIKVDTSKECEHQEEIKRLRNLHMQALEESRQDGDSQILHLREAHATEIDAIKSSSYHTRNIESMMAKVEESTEKLQQLSSKYESAHRAMTQQSETIALSNKQLISVVQNQLSQQQRSTSDAHIQMQQTASRLEGLVSEMNRKMDEQHYAMQLTHSNLQSAHAALQEERKQFMQQITLEREHLRKAHREMINLQSEMRQEMREDREKLLRAADDLSSVTTRFEEARITEAEQAHRRKREHEEMLNNMNTEKMEMAKKKAQMESDREKLSSRGQDLNNKFIQLNEEKRILQQIQIEFEQKEAEMAMLTQRMVDSEQDKERVFSEAKRLEGEQGKKLAEIHNELNELAKQRQLLAEERKALAQERSSGFVSATNSPITVHPTSYPAPTSTTVTPVKQRLLMGHPGSPAETSATGLALWQHSAKKDRSFLDDEQFFLETLKNSPYGKKS